MRAALILLYVKDLPRMAAFYGGPLGLVADPKTRSDTWVEFDAGAIRLGLHAIPAGIAAGIEIAEPPVVREETPLKLIFAAEDVAAEAKRLEALGVTVFQHPWGSFDALDPEGNVFGIAPAR
jgi:extradiol dioxygenase family protein